MRKYTVQAIRRPSATCSFVKADFCIYMTCDWKLQLLSSFCTFAGFALTSKKNVVLPKKMPKQNHYTCMKLGTTYMCMSLNNITFSTSVLGVTTLVRKCFHLVSNSFSTQFFFLKCSTLFPLMRIWAHVPILTLTAFLVYFWSLQSMLCHNEASDNFFSPLFIITCYILPDQIQPSLGCWN